MEKCKKCGYCCYVNIYNEDASFHTDQRCPHLMDNNECKIYLTRNVWRPDWCMTIEELTKKGLSKFLPDTCGYK